MTIKIKNKSKLNLIIDAVMLLALMAIAGLGFLIKFVLVPGFKRNELYGSDVELYFLGFTRQKWGDIHFRISFLFLLLMLLHIIFHWKNICSMYKKLISNKKMRNAIAIAIMVLSVFLITAPLFVQPTVNSLIREHSHSHFDQDLNSNPSFHLSERDLSVRKQTGEKLSNNNSELEIKGSMSLKEVSIRYHIPVEKLANALDIPVSQIDERLGRLRKQYSFQMEDVKQSVIKLKEH